MFQKCSGFYSNSIDNLFSIKRLLPYRITTYILDRLNRTRKEQPMSYLSYFMELATVKRGRSTVIFLSTSLTKGYSI